MSPLPHHSQAVVVGAGPAGLVAALSLATAGVATTLAAAPHRPAGMTRDRRTAALFNGSVELLRNLGLWDALAADCAPLAAIRLIDDTGRLFRAPEVTFHAREFGLEAFGYNVPNDALVDALSACAAMLPGLNVHATVGSTGVKIRAGHATIQLAEGGELVAPLAVAADGRQSALRRAAGIEVKTWNYPQTALVTWFTHQRPHHGISTEFHRSDGPFTTVPLPGNASSLVWVAEPADADKLLSLPEPDMRRAIETRLSGLLGTVGEIGPRATFPLSGLTPSTFAMNRVALVGESGHVLPPIGAQGLNLGFRDAATLVDCVIDALAEGRDPGGSAVMQRYSELRAPDVNGRMTAIDVLNRTLLSPYLPVHLLRGFGLYALSAISPLRRRIVQEGVQPASYVPRLMRPGGLHQLQNAAATTRLASPA